MKILSSLLIIFGIFWCLLGGYYWWLMHSPTRLQFENVTPQQIEKTSLDNKTTIVQPTRVIIKDLAIDLPIYPAKIEDDIWETTYEGASYLVTSPIPGETGNSILYGHNWTSLFGNLIHAKPGEMIEIVYRDGSKKKFIIDSTQIVSPTQSDILAKSNDKRITLYTCTGFLDSKRFVVVAKLAPDTLTSR